MSNIKRVETALCLYPFICFQEQLQGLLSHRLKDHMPPKTNHPKLTICFILEYYYPHVGGREILFQELAEGLMKDSDLPV